VNWSQYCEAVSLKFKVKFDAGSIAGYMLGVSEFFFRYRRSNASFHDPKIQIEMYSEMLLNIAMINIALTKNYPEYLEIEFDEEWKIWKSLPLFVQEASRIYLLQGDDIRLLKSASLMLSFCLTQLCCQPIVSDAIAVSIENMKNN
jgi:hypothetical protein